VNRKPPRLSLIERALIEKQWRETAVSAQIHALIGDNSDGMVNGAGRVMFVVLGAAIAEGISHERPEIRIIRGALNAVHDQAGEPQIPADRRASIISGLEACDRLIPELQRRSLINAACDLTLKMRRQHIHYSDFLALVEQGATT
jgi:hypothetical protein